MGYRLAVISDVHADLHALQDALRAIDAMRPDAIVCAGDLVDYGLFPNETIALLASRQIPCIRGNHDRWSGEGKGQDLTLESRSFLGALPLSWERVLERVRVAVHHASPRRDMDGVDPVEIDVTYARSLLDRAEADVLIVGHTHVAFCLDVPGRGVIVNPAAILRAPADGTDNPPATGTFGILDLPGCAFTVHRARDGAEVSILRRTF